METLYLDGSNFSNLKQFYDEVERSLTFSSGGEIGHNLDAFDEVIDGGFGRHECGEPVTLIWLNSKRSRRVLGQTETEKYLLHTLGVCHPTSTGDIKQELALVRNGEGEMLFDKIVEIIRDHKHVVLRLM